MKSKVQSLRAFLASADRFALVEVASTKGSTPREKGAFMLVSQAATFGTIGGGQLEYIAIDKARQMVGSSPSPLWGGSATLPTRGRVKKPASASTKSAPRLTCR
ncbi:XdhC family protein [Mesorhizobium sp. LNJC380A00]|uniref:XdhC family protein n=1 Tax=Mesorhizobium sp. LNJC380A00 TaxID=1287264 RepID=UPI001FD9AD86|nr:XdhC family protein [Mesorhizobium sp. LNJC380A00]